MKKLFVIRHAKSSWNYPDLDDIDRPLNKRGKRNAPEMGKRLSVKGVKPDLLITSPAKRAASTAKKIAKALSYPKDQIVIDQNLYHGTNQEVIDVIRNASDKIGTLMIFGHNPGFTELVNHLSGSSIYNIPTCGIAEIGFDIQSWKDIDKIKGKLIDFDYPKKVSINQL
jgi:phosphohistidine phosphatase